MQSERQQDRTATAVSHRDDRLLDTYYRDVAGRDLLTAEDEQRLARTIEAYHADAWVAMVAYPRATAYVLDRIVRDTELTEEEAQPLRRAAAAAISTRRVKQQRKLEQLARELAARMRSLDQDRECFDALQAHLEHLRREPRPGGKRLPFSPASKAFGAYLSSIRRSEATAAAARTAFVEANLRLVLTFARKHQGRGVPLSDLIQEGNLGLIKAVDRFDYRRGYRFSTFASWWIRHMLGREVANTARTVRVPVHVQDTQQRISGARRMLRERLRRNPTDEEVAEAAGVSVDKLIETYQRVYGGVVSLDEPVGDEEGRSRAEVFKDPNSAEHTSFDDVSKKHEAEAVRSLLARLSPIQEDVLRKRFGLDDGRCWTLREIGDYRALTRERIRQIQVAALEKLRTLIDQRTH